MKILVIFVLLNLCLGSYAFANVLPQDVAYFIYKRDQCDHLRGEMSGELEIDEARDLKTQLDLYCKGTDQDLPNLKNKYRNDAKFIEALNMYDENMEPDHSEDE